MKPSRALAARLGRFGLVGLIATAIHVGVGLGLHHAFAVPPLWANGVAFSVAVVANFAGQSRLTFPEAVAGGRAFLRFVIAALLAFLLNQLIVWAVTGPLGRPYWVALAIVLASVPVLSFCAMRFWAFRG